MKLSNNMPQWYKELLIDVSNSGLPLAEPLLNAEILNTPYSLLCTVYPDEIAEHGDGPRRTVQIVWQDGTSIVLEYVTKLELLCKREPEFDRYYALFNMYSGGWYVCNPVYARKTFEMEAVRLDEGQPC